MKPRAVTVGILVTVHTPVRARMLGGFTRDELTLELGTVCITRYVNVPKVRIVAGPGKDSRDIFVRVEFNTPAGVHCDAAVNYCNLVKLSSPSWVLVSKDTGRPEFETFNERTAAAVNLAKYRVLPIMAHLQEFNARVKAAANE